MIELNTNWLNKTEAKDPRKSVQFDCIVWHETDSPNPYNSPATLNYMLSRSNNASYHYLIGQDGTIYHFVDETRFIAWHTGQSTMTIDGTTTRDYANNVRSIGISLDARITRLPKIPSSQKAIQSAINLLVHLHKTYGLSLDRSRNQDHKGIAPGRRRDPDTFNTETAILIPARILVNSANPPGTFPIDQDFLKAWSASGGVWIRSQLTPGYAISPPYYIGKDKYQRFERGVIKLNENGSLDWLLLSEINMHQITETSKLTLKTAFTGDTQKLTEEN